ncbi:MAG: MgtC/SapB family protein [Planctomycetaceae bacterium]
MDFNGGWPAELELLKTVGIAGGLGALIGLEREFWDKPAGLRTHIMVCAGAALFVLLGKGVMDSFEEGGAALIQADPLRVIQAVIIGISFLGTGTILHRDDRVEGLTTAATIFLTAGIGIAVAVDRLVLATGTALLAVTVLVGIGWLERIVQRGRKDEG